MNELDTICPVQFIEGRNKFAELDKPAKVGRDAYLQYVPKISYCVARIDMYLAWSSIPERQENRLQIYADYLDRPTDIILTEGKLVFDQGEAPLTNWKTVDICRPVVLIAHKRYWLHFSEVKTDFQFYAAKKGDKIATMSQKDDKWQALPDLLMLRFYGRILPIAILY